MSARIDAINAAAAAIRKVDPTAAAFAIAATVVDAVSPIIRADEREKCVERAERAATQHEFCLADGFVYDTLVSLNEVCSLINPEGGESDGRAGHR